MNDWFHEPGTRTAVPLLTGISGAPSSGKTFSALRLGTGIQRIVGGELFVIDTENRRARHYGDNFRFQHVDFQAPFSSIRYLQAFRYCVNQGGRVIIVDSMSHEHMSDGGYLDFHEKEVERLAGGDTAKAMRVQRLAWTKPAAARLKLITGLLQLNANFIFCFRAKEKTDQKKNEIVPLGYMPIAGVEFLFEQTLNILLMPNSKGVPTWRSDLRGESELIKLPLQFEKHFLSRNGESLDETDGEFLARWASGSAAPPLPPDVPGAVDGSPQQSFSPAGASISPEEWKQWDAMLHAAARCGDTPAQRMASLKGTFDKLGERREAMRDALERRHKPAARDMR